MLEFGSGINGKFIPESDGFLVLQRTIVETEDHYSELKFELAEISEKELPEFLLNFPDGFRKTRDNDSVPLLMEDEKKNK